jgi:hypothetical protein
MAKTTRKLVPERKPVRDSLFKVQRRHNEDFLERGLGKIDLSLFIQQWSFKYPIDRLWREKYNVKFNSDIHRQTTIVDMILDLAEDTLFREILSGKPEDQYIPNTGNYLKKSNRNKLTQQEIESSFDDLDIHNLEYDEDGNLIL